MGGFFPVATIEFNSREFSPNHIIYSGCVDFVSMPVVGIEKQGVHS